MSHRTLSWVKSALSPHLRGHDVGDSADATWIGATTDSRGDCAGRLFFAIPGERVDGHNYVESAFAAGCVAAVIERADKSDALSQAGIPYLVVTDTRRALQELARVHRDRLQVRVVAVTGSSGKTTTKEYVRAVLKTRFRVHANFGNLNSLIGVPLTVLDTDENTDYLVCEVGANQVGEVAFLAGLLRPDVGVVTNIGDAHVGHFGSPLGVAEAKSELFEPMGSNTRILLPRDDRYFDLLKARAHGKVFTFGTSPRADFVLSNVRSHRRGVSFEVNGEAMDVPVLGRYNALNATVAFAVGDICGVDAATIRSALAAAGPMPGRGRMHEVAGAVLIDESYNSSPASLKLSLAMLAEMDAERRIAVLGDMLELGEYADEAHAETGRMIASLPIDVVYWIGDYGRTVARGASDGSDSPRVVCAGGMDDLVDAVLRDKRSGDVILVKGSRGCKLDVFVSRFMSSLSGKDN